MLILCLYLTFEKEKKINNGKRKLAPTDSCKFFLKSFDQEEEILPLKKKGCALRQNKHGSPLVYAW